MITEFVENLGWTSQYDYANSCYGTYLDGNQAASADVNYLRGLDDALWVLKASGYAIKEAK